MASSSWGGATRPTVSAARGRASIGGNVERLISFTTLAKRYPEARLLFLGGSDRIGGEPLSQADVARTVLADMGLDVGRVLFEGESKNTTRKRCSAATSRIPSPARCGF